MVQTQKNINIEKQLTYLREIRYNSFCAGVAKLADALDLGSSAIGVQVQILSPAPLEFETAII